MDAEDIGPLSADRLEELVLHEMGHVLGIGVLWGPSALLEYDTDNCLDADAVSYVGAEGVAAHKAVGGEGPPAAEEEGGGGTKCYHWDEAAFQTELMTGFFNLDQDNPLSRLTAASLIDLGYEVDISAADNYLLPAASALRTQGAGFALREELIQPYRGN